MWSQGSQWPLDAAAYQNMNHDLVDWASLAQQWIRMKEVHETVVLNVPQVSQNPFACNMNTVMAQPYSGLHATDSVSSGEAPMDVEKEDEVVYSPLDWVSNQNLSQPTMCWPLHNGPQVVRPLFPQGSYPGVSHPLTASTSNQGFNAGSVPANFSPRLPLLPLPSTRQNSSDDDSLGASSFPAPILDASKRKNLPAWIREGLEKMEKEKQKKEEREKILQERELRRRRSKTSGVEVAERSRFDSEDSESDEVEKSDETYFSVSQNDQPPISLEDMMVKIRQLMTEILLEVTTEEIKLAAQEAVQRSNVKIRQPQSPLSSKSLTRKLGLDHYGSDSDGEDSNSGDDCSDVDLRDGKQNAGVCSGVRKSSADGTSSTQDQAFKADLQYQSKNENHGVLKEGFKVDTDISNSFSCGKDDNAVVSSRKNEDYKGMKSELNVNSGKVEFIVSNKISCSPEKRTRSRSNDRRYDHKRSHYRRSNSRRRSRSRERYRSNSRRRSRSRDRKRSSSRRRSRSKDRKNVRDRNEKDKSKERKK